jgi:MFS family permease
MDQRIWILFYGRIISATGFSIVMPFLAVYLNDTMHISAPEIGLIYLGMAVFGAIGQMIGGELADQLGRRPVMYMSMSLRGFTFLILFFVLMLTGNVWLMAILLFMSSLLGSFFDPASNAIVADIVPQGQRLEAYSLLRVGQNVGWTLGPLISGLMIMLLPFSSLFFVAAITSMTVSVVIMWKVNESARTSEHHERFHPRDLLKIGESRLFMIFCLSSLPLAIVLGQMSTTFSMFSHDVAVARLSYAEIGYLYALNGLMVVFLQFPMARIIGRYRLSYVLAAGAMMYAFGYFILGLNSAWPILVLSMVITTLGENTISPSSTNMVAKMSPENQRGRYMGAFGIFNSFGWSIGPTVGTTLYALFYSDPLMLWTSIAMIAMISAAGFAYLGRLTDSSYDKLVEEPARAKT